MREKHTEIHTHVHWETHTVLEESTAEGDGTDKIELKPNNEKSDESKESSTVEQILQLSSIKEKGMISEDEFNFIKNELIKKLKG